MNNASRMNEQTENISSANSLTAKHHKKEKNSCPECASVVSIHDIIRGEIICSQCGLVLDSNIIDLGPEWRAFTKEQRDLRRRVGSPINYMRSEKGLTTTLGWGFRDGRGRMISAHRRAEIHRMRKWQRRSRQNSSIERNLGLALREAERLISQMRLPFSIKDSVAILYRKILSRNLIRGRTIEGIIAAVLYIICRKFQIPITIKEISQHSRIDEKSLGRIYRFIMKEFDVNIPTVSPKGFVPRFAEELNLPKRVERYAIKILEMAKQKLIISGKAPTGLAAAALYIASITRGHQATQREIADVANVTEVTIRNRYKELSAELNLKMEM
jgi:transcription initiation factor TFIIB